MASGFYNSAKVDLANGVFDFDNDVFWVMLVTSSYAEDFDAHNRRDDITNEVSGAGYTAGGKVINVLSVTQNNTDNRAEVLFEDVEWTVATITARGAVIYKRNGGLASADQLVCYLDFTTNQSTSGGTFTIDFNAPLTIT